MDEIDPYYTEKGKRIRVCRAKCLHCGSIEKKSIYSLMSSRPQVSCGCMTKEITSIKNKKHGDRYTRLYKIWCGIKYRTLSNHTVATKNYKSKGVGVSKDWMEYYNFKAWALSNGYTDDLSIDRINPYGDYEASNCRWANREVQGANKRRINTRNTSGYLGVTYDTKSGKWVSQIEFKTNGKRKNVKLGRFKDPIEGAYKRDKYIEKNNLPHTKNFKLVVINV